MDTLSINELLEKILKGLRDEARDNLECLILYGSWAKGTARADSDIDLLAVLREVGDETKRTLHKIEEDMCEEASISLLPVSIEDFLKERIPLYTAVKREGKIIYGTVDLAINPEPPHTKYAEYFKKSKEFETQKVTWAEEMLKRHPSYGSADLCFIAAKHAIQMALAMKGKGYSSKVAVLLPLAKEHLGVETGEAFRRLFELYVKSEYGVEFLSEEEARLAVKCAKKVLAKAYGE